MSRRCRFGGTEAIRNVDIRAQQREKKAVPPREIASEKMRRRGAGGVK